MALTSQKEVRETGSYTIVSVVCVTYRGPVNQENFQPKFVDFTSICRWPHLLIHPLTVRIWRPVQSALDGYCDPPSAWQSLSVCLALFVPVA